MDVALPGSLYLAVDAEILDRLKKDNLYAPMIRRNPVTGYIWQVGRNRNFHWASILKQDDIIQGNGFIDSSLPCDKKALQDRKSSIGIAEWRIAIGPQPKNDKSKQNKNTQA